MTWQTWSGGGGTQIQTMSANPRTWLYAEYFKQQNESNWRIF
jgi:hypothetical protein